MCRLRQEFAEAEIDSILVWQPENRLYLSGFTGTSGALVITGDRNILVTDFRYLEQAKSQAPGYEVIKNETGLADDLAKILAELDVVRIGFEADFLTCKQFHELEQRLSGRELIPLEDFTEQLRIRKDKTEIRLIEEAAGLADRAFSHILPKIRVGIREKEIALELELFMRRNGADGTSFEFIIASGPRGSLPHGTASHRQLEQEDMVTMDFGCVLNGYCSDITRTVFLSEPNSRQREIYNVVLTAQEAGIRAVRPGTKASEVDAACRRVIESAGFGAYFGHSTGHGVGLSVHERPSLSARSEAVLEPGMVVTIEPGIYLPGWGGVRIEDMAVVTNDGCRVLTGSPKSQICAGGFLGSPEFYGEDRHETVGGK